MTQCQLLNTFHSKVVQRMVPPPIALELLVVSERLILVLVMVPRRIALELLVVLERLILVLVTAPRRIALEVLR